MPETSRNIMEWKQLTRKRQSGIKILTNTYHRAGGTPLLTNNRFIFDFSHTTSNCFDNNIGIIKNGGFQLADKGVLTSFITAAMKQCKLEHFEDGTLYCEIPSCPGVWASGDSLEECIVDLRQTLEFWLLLKLRDGDLLPVFGDLDINEIVSGIYETDD